MNTRLHTHAILMLAMLMLSTYVSAQRSRTVRKPQISAQEQILKSYTDSLAEYRRMTDSLMIANDSLREANGAMITSKYFNFFSPITFQNNLAGNILSLNGRQNSVIDDAMLHLYLTRPDLVQFTTSQLYSSAKTSGVVTSTPRERLELTSQVVPDARNKSNESVVTQQPLDLYVSKPHFWTFNGDYYLQFMQNYISPNWYKSGSNNYSMLGIVTLQYNYNNKQKVKWDNKLEMKLGFQTTEADTVNKFKTSEDLIRYTSKIGLQAHKNWYYTMQVIANTQFSRGLKDNKTDVFSDFMSPFNLNLSLGMDYTLETKNKKLKGTAHLAPLAYNYKYVDRLYLAKSFGIDEGHHSLQDFGSQVTIEMTWQPIEMVKWQTRLYAYTTYHKIEAEWENTISFKFNKYISANLFLYPRLDDSIQRKDDDNLIQFKEYLSFGFSYSM